MGKETIVSKLGNIKENFPDVEPIELLKKWKKLLSYSESNITYKRKLLDRLIKNYDLDFTPSEFIMYQPLTFSKKLEHLSIGTRILKKYNIEKDKVIKKFAIINNQNLENLIIADDKVGGGDFSVLLSESE